MRLHLLLVLLLLAGHTAAATRARPAAAPGAQSAGAAPLTQPITLALLDMGETQTAERVVAQLTRTLTRGPDITIVNRAAARAAARGVGYQGSLNLTLAEARDLGAAIGCDFMLLGTAATLRRSAFARADYFEAAAALFLVSARTGRLLSWTEPRAEAANADTAERALLAALTDDSAARAVAQMQTARVAERTERLAALAHDTPIIAAAPEADTPAAAHFRPPRPYRRLQPKYTAAAARAAVEATVDVVVALDAGGEVLQVEVVRWAGYELDESVIATVRQLHFFPAHMDGQPVPIRVLLRYNFRKPPKEPPA